MTTVDYSKDALISEFALRTLNERYLTPDEASPQDAFIRVANKYGDNENHSQRLYDYMSSLWFIPSTPILANGGTTRGLPISCYLNTVQDSREGLAEHWRENMFLSSNGGGIGTYFGDIRSNGASTSRGSKSTGLIPFLKVDDALVPAISQGVTRLGASAVYIDISHPEIEEFIDIRKPTGGGDPYRKCTQLHHGVNITDDFMAIVYDAIATPHMPRLFNLVDPNSGRTVKQVDAVDLWLKILETRFETGEPYIHFIDQSNRNMHQCQIDKGLKIKQSNLCSEIILPTNDERTAVCCLSSVNLEHYDTWKDVHTFIPDLVRFLDNVLQDFIDNAPPELHKAVYSATQERSIGIGAMGYHSYLQSRMIPLESPVALGITRQMHEHIMVQAQAASGVLAMERGNAPDAKDVGRYGYVRNVHLIAIAPNANSGIIADTSPSIEPYSANAYKERTLAGTNVRKNKHLKKVLAEVYDKDTDEVWTNIEVNQGSVQHLDWMSDIHKEVFKTAREIDQMWLVEHAAVRQPYIDQAQSLNVFFKTGANRVYIHNVHMQAWLKGLKTLYYGRGEAAYRAENINNQLVTTTLPDYMEQSIQEEVCVACQG